MRWSRMPPLSGLGASTRPKKSSYLSDDGVYVSCQTTCFNRRNQRTKQVVWQLTEGGRFIGQAFYTAKLAKAFAEAFAALGDDQRARREMIRNGAQWCFDWERAERLRLEEERRRRG